MDNFQNWMLKELEKKTLPRGITKLNNEMLLASNQPCSMDTDTGMDTKFLKGGDIGMARDKAKINK